MQKNFPTLLLSRIVSEWEEELCDSACGRDEIKLNNRDAVGNKQRIAPAKNVISSLLFFAALSLSFAVFKVNNLFWLYSAECVA